MVNKQNNNSAGARKNQGKNEFPRNQLKLDLISSCNYCCKRLGSFGGLLGVMKFLDLVNIKGIIDGYYDPPDRETEMGTVTRS